jgi:hypothetical protein
MKEVEQVYQCSITPNHVENCDQNFKLINALKDNRLANCIVGNTGILKGMRIYLYSLFLEPFFIDTFEALAKLEQ